MRKTMRIALVPLLAAALLAFTPSAADAQTAGLATVQGNGTITPGLDTTPQAQQFTFQSVSITTTGVLDGAPVVAGTSGCFASGSSGATETVAAGNGSGSWSCSSGPLAGFSGGLTYARAGAAVAVVLSGDLAGGLACAFVPTTGNGVTAPVTSYNLACGGLGAAA